MYLLSQLRGMTDSSKSFASTTNQRLYFDSYQDVTTAYDLVNLNVRMCFTLIFVYALV